MLLYTYNEKGQFSVNVTILGQNEDCGEWEYTDRERAMVVVCEEPAPADGFDGMFTYTGDKDLIYQMVKLIPIAVMLKQDIQLVIYSIIVCRVNIFL